MSRVWGPTGEKQYYFILAPEGPNTLEQTVPVSWTEAWGAEQGEKQTENDRELKASFSILRRPGFRRVYMSVGY